MSRMRRSWVLLAGCAAIAAGCGSKPSVPASTEPALAGPNRRYQMKDEYKQVLGKDGQMLWKQGMKLPPGAGAAGGAVPPKP